MCIIDIKYCDICGCVVKTTKRTFMVPESVSPFSLKQMMDKMVAETAKEGGIPRYGMNCDACDECWQDFDEICKVWELNRRKITEGKRWKK